MVNLRDLPPPGCSLMDVRTSTYTAVRLPCMSRQLHTVKRVGAILLVVLPLFIPEVVVEFTSLPVDAALVIAGILPAIIGWTYAPRYALRYRLRQF